MGEAKMLDYYRTLQVDPQASKEVVEKAYRALSMKYHPDKNANQNKKEMDRAAEEWMTIRAAYEILSDDQKRSAYDNTRKREVFSVFWSDGLLGLACKYLR